MIDSYAEFGIDFDVRLRSEKIRLELIKPKIQPEVPQLMIF